MSVCCPRHRASDMPLRTRPALGSSCDVRRLQYPDKRRPARSSCRTQILVASRTEHRAVVQKRKLRIELNFREGLAIIGNRRREFRAFWLCPRGRLPVTTPARRISSIRSLRLNGAALPSLAQSGLKAICETLRLSAHSAAPFEAPPWMRTMSGCLAWILSRAAQMRAWSLQSVPPEKAILGPLGRSSSFESGGGRQGTRGCR